MPSTSIAAHRHCWLRQSGLTSCRAARTCAVPIRHALL